MSDEEREADEEHDAAPDDDPATDPTDLFENTEPLDDDEEPIRVDDASGAGGAGGAAERGDDGDAEDSDDGAAADPPGFGDSLGGADVADVPDAPAIDRTASGDVADATDDPTPELPGETADDDREGPLGDVASRLERRRREHDRDDAPYDDLFDEVDVGEVDREALWEQIAADEPIDDAFEDGVDERVVKKSTYCQRCEYFAEPPDLHCTHDGTRILEVVDMDSFRVRNCPVVAEDDELETLGGPDRGRSESADGEE